jgi:hypothetical protein
MELYRIGGVIVTTIMTADQDRILIANWLVVFFGYVNRAFCDFLPEATLRPNLIFDAVNFLKTWD